MAKHPRWARHLLSHADFDAIIQAIVAAEAGTSAEIRVHLERRVHGGPSGKTGDAQERARKVFTHLGMHRTAERHGVLIYLALEDRRLAIVGDEGVHFRVGDQYWAHVRDLMVERLRSGTTREAIVAAIHDMGRVLHEHFPKRAGDVNESTD